MKAKPLRTRAAFTLIELMMVLLVITILAALLLAAIGGVWGTANATRVYAELTQLGAALDSFKAKYGCYPPSRIRLKENMTYDPQDPFDAHSMQYLRKIWPSIQLETSTPQQATSVDPLFVWCADSDASGAINGTYELEGDECLVFFLGGISQFDRDNPETIILQGFSKDPRNPSGVPDPLNPASLNRNEPLFEFGAGRLYVRRNVPGAADQVSPAPVADEEWGSSSGVVYVDPTISKLPSYADMASHAANEPRPIVYFNSYADIGHSGGYRAHDCNLPEDPQMAISFQRPWPVVSTDSTPHPVSEGPNPYTVTPAGPAAGATPAIFQPYKPSGYQLLTPGEDGLFGQGGQVGGAGAAPLAAGDLDNICSFGEGKTIEDFGRSQGKK